ncbi:MAG TPA: glycerol-3-phosphate dehydrogenase/oxidase [Actinomycetota bacterium]|nr:glycerol-3-phosphate dehydrogenase/oxidase [Actinomycetota bacterium]
MGSGTGVAAGGLGSRADALQKLEESSRAPFDLLVIGGGITGAGVALDAASRGMKVGLIERLDFASGTSSKSSKLVHGGLRYLEQRELRLVREASTERELLSRLAPHLVQPAQFVIPISNRWRRAMFGVGLWTYDALASFKNIKVHRYLDIAETERLVPPLPKGKLQGGFMFYDNKTDDVRLVMEVLVQARRYGATVANYARLSHLEGGEEICVAQVHDEVADKDFEVRAKRVVVAAGVWSDQVESMTGTGGEARIRPSKGIHLVFRREMLPMGDAAAFIPDADGKRMLFVIPWLDAILVGTTDTSYEGPMDRPSVEPHDRAYILDAVNGAFEMSLTEADIAGAYAGLRPLIKGKAGATADLSRRHVLYDIDKGVIGITGGKLTTYRRMASDTVDRVASDLGIDAKSKTRHIKLGSSNVVTLHLAVERRAARLGLSSEMTTNLVRCYGDRALEVLDHAESEGMTETLVPGFPMAAVEAVYGARREMVIRLSDFLARRTRLSLIDSEAGVGDASRAPDVLAAELGWSSAEREKEIDEHRTAIEHERGIPTHPAAVEPAGTA